MPPHIPVLLPETLAVLQPKPGDSVLDCTLGLGGHSEELLRMIGDAGMLVGLDADEKNLATAMKRLEPHKHHAIFVHANFRQIPQCLPEDRREFDLILADLGLSSPHIDDTSRGFSFRGDAPLDMRFDQSRGMTAAMLIASLDRDSLRDIFQTYGELPSSHRLADALIERRTSAPIRTSADLSDAAKSMYSYKAKDHLAQIFQALRIAVNDEMGALRHLLAVAPTLLRPNGRLAVISYHSLEDRLVKQTMKELTMAPKDPVTGADTRDAEFVLLTPKAVQPSDDEQKKNPRSRSARLRAIRRQMVYTPRP